VQTLDDTRVAWDRIAPGYDEFVTPTHMWLADEGLRRVALQEGMSFLDVAAGSGALSIPAARLDAQVLSVDLSPTMVDRLERRAKSEGLSNLRALVMDGHALEFPDSTFDVVGSQFGVMLFPDLPRGLREMTRVTKPGGRVLMSVYGPPAKIEFLSFMVAAIRAAVPDFHGLPSDPPPLPFQVADPERLRQELVGAGLKEVRIETITEALTFRSGSQLWDWIVNSNPVGAELVADLTDTQRSVVQRELEGMIRDRAAGNDVAVLTNPIHIAIGKK
jgi:ubiquinone/menaquinone biosynthesis C-methylase UbiE